VFLAATSPAAATTLASSVGAPLRPQSLLQRRQLWHTLWARTRGLNLSSNDDCGCTPVASISPAATTTLAHSVGAHPWPQSLLNLSCSDDKSGTLCRRVFLAATSPAAATTLASSVGAPLRPQSLLQRRRLWHTLWARTRGLNLSSSDDCGCTPVASISPAATTTLAHSVGAHPWPQSLPQRR